MICKATNYVPFEDERAVLDADGVARPAAGLGGECFLDSVHADADDSATGAWRMTVYTYDAAGRVTSIVEGTEWGDLNTRRQL